MERTGTLSIVNGESRLDGTLLARCDESDPIGAATAFLLNRGFQSGDVIRVTGTDGTIGGVAVFCMEDVQPAAAAAPLGIRAAKKATKKAPKKAAKKATKRATKKSAKKAAKQTLRSKKKGASKSRKGKSGRRS